MSTRLERWKKSKLKHTARMRRAQGKRGQTSRGFFEGEYMQGPTHPITRIGQLQPPAIKAETRRAQETRVLQDYPFFYEYTEPGRGQFPVVTFHPLFRTAPGFDHHAKPHALIGMQYRSRVRLGLKPGRMKGKRRVMSACNLCRFLNGYYPNDDPLSRRPSEDDVFGIDEVEPLPVGFWPEP